MHQPQFELETLEPRIMLSADSVSGAAGAAVTTVPAIRVESTFVEEDTFKDSLKLKSQPVPSFPVAWAEVQHEDANSDDASEAGLEDGSTNTSGGSEAVQSDRNYTNRSREVDPAESIREVVFVDPAISDYESLVEQFRNDVSNSNLEVVYLNSDSDGVNQITEYLENKEDISALHILSHGSEGKLSLGNSIFSVDKLRNYYSELSQWGNALTDKADILLYACNVVDGKWGVKFVHQLADLTGADVAASDDITGRRGNWELEYATGDIESKVTSTENLSGYQGILKTSFANGSKPMIIDVTNTIIKGGEVKNDTFEVGDVLNLIGSGGTLKFENATGSNINVRAIALDKLSLTGVTGLGTVTITGFKNVVGLKNVAFDAGDQTDIQIRKGKDQASIGSDGPIVEGLSSVVASNADDLVTIYDGADFSGSIDGGGGLNTLNYFVFEGKADVDLSGLIATQPEGGLANFTNITGGLGTSGLFVTNKGNLLTGNDADNSIIGGPQSDTITGKAGSDTLSGNRGDDIYNFSLSDFQNAAHKDTVIEQENGGKFDALDFSAIAAEDESTGDIIALEFSINDLVNTGLQVELGRNGLSDGLLFNSNIKNVEKIVPSLGINVFKFSDKWSGPLGSNPSYIERSLDRFDIRFDETKFKIRLDFSQVTHDLIFEIGPDGAVSVYEATTNDKGETTKVKKGSIVIAKEVYDIVGGQGNNIYRFESGGALLGNLIGGSSSQAVGKQNVLDYSKYGAAIVANLGYEDVVLSSAVPVVSEPLGFTTGVLPKQAEWIFDVPLLEGAISLANGVASINFSYLDDTSIDEQRFKESLASILGRNDFSVNKESVVQNQVDAQGNRLGNTVWTVKFSEPGIINGYDSQYTATNAGSSGIKITTGGDGFIDSFISPVADQIKQALQKDSYLSTVEVVGGASGPWSVVYSGKSVVLDDTKKIVSWDSDVTVSNTPLNNDPPVIGDRSIRHTTVSQGIDVSDSLNFTLSFDGQSENFTRESAIEGYEQLKSDIKQWLLAFNKIDQVEIIGSELSGGFLTVDYRSSFNVTEGAFTGNETITTGSNSTISVSASTVVKTYYSQQITLSSSASKNEFYLGFGHSDLNPASEVPGVEGVDLTYAVYNNSIGGKFKLNFGFVDLSAPNELIALETVDIDYNASPDVLREALQAEIDAEQAAVDELRVTKDNLMAELEEERITGASQAEIDALLTEINELITQIDDLHFSFDLPPQVKVTGMGTKDFPWRISFSNMGDLSLTAINGFDNINPSDPLTVLANTAPGVPGVFLGINDIIGSGEEDRIYGIVEPEQGGRRIASFTSGSFDKDDSLDETIFDAEVINSKVLRINTVLGLNTGQAVRYETDREGAFIGLESGRVYYLGVNVDAQSTGDYPNGKTDITFYATPEEADKHTNRFFSKPDAIEFERPNRFSLEPNTVRFFEVSSAKGGKGDDTLVADLENSSNTLIGGKGGDVISGSNGSDYIGGGNGNDILYGDGSHEIEPAESSLYIDLQAKATLDQALTEDEIRVALKELLTTYVSDKGYELGTGAAYDESTVSSLSISFSGDYAAGSSTFVLPSDITQIKTDIKNGHFRLAVLHELSHIVTNVEDFSPQHISPKIEDLITAIDFGGVSGTNLDAQKEEVRADLKGILLQYNLNGYLPPATLIENWGETLTPDSTHPSEKIRIQAMKDYVNYLGVQLNEDLEDIVYGNDGDDRVLGMGGDDILYGGDGKDVLVGGTGNDIVSGGGGDDKLEIIESGFLGDYDIMRGGLGSDEYIFQGDWGIASLQEQDNFASNLQNKFIKVSQDTIDLSSVGKNQVHVLSNGTLFSTPGTLFNSKSSGDQSITVTNGPAGLLTWDESAKTITRDPSVGSWTDEGFEVGMKITVNNASEDRNNGIFTLKGVTEKVLTLGEDDIIVNSTDTDAAAAKSIVGRFANTSDIRLTNGETVRLATAYEDLTSSQTSSGEVLTEIGLGFHQTATGESGRNVGDGNANATLLAFGDLPTVNVDGQIKIRTTSDLNLRLWVDLGSGGKAYDLAIEKGVHDTTAFIDNLKGQLSSQLLGEDEMDISINESGLITVRHALVFTAKADGSLDDNLNVKPAHLEISVNSDHAIVVNQDNFERFEKIKLGDSSHTLLFGNDYWGGGTSATGQLVQTVGAFAPVPGLAEFGARFVQQKLTVDTELTVKENNSIVLDFRQVNHELRFAFSPIEGDPDRVQLKVETVQDLTLPLVGKGPVLRNQTLSISHIDKNTVIYAGRYKNLFAIDKGAVFQGRFVGGEGGAFGGALTFPGRSIDKLRDGLTFFENGATGLNTQDLAKIYFTVQNTVTYTSPIESFVGNRGKTGQGFLLPNYINMEKLVRPEAADFKAVKSQLVLGNVIGPAIDRYHKARKDGEGPFNPDREFGTTGVSGIVDNFKDINLGEVVVNGGINLVRGTDYVLDDLLETFDDNGNPFAIVKSGADTITVGGLEPGLHLLAGGSGADTYKFKSDFWGAALIVDDLFSVNFSTTNDAVDATLGAIFPSDRADFSRVTKDLYFTAWRLSTADIGFMKSFYEATGLDSIGFDVGVTAVLVTTASPLDSEGNFSLEQAVTNPYVGFAEAFKNIGNASPLDLYPPSFAITIGVENILGGRGDNTFTFVDGATLGGRIEPGYGGTVTMNYADFLESDDTDGIDVDLGSGADFEVLPSLTDIVDSLGLGDIVPGYLAETLLPSNVTYQFGNATGLGDGTLGVAVGSNVTGTDNDDTIIGNTNSNTLIGGAGMDVLDGEVGKDILDGGSGNDELRGGGDDDTITAGTGNDSVNGGGGSDIYVANSDASLIIYSTGSTYTEPNSAIVSTTLSGGVVEDSVTVNDGGSGYIPNTTINVEFETPEGGTVATGTATVNSSGEITSVSVVDGGSGYVNAPTKVIIKSYEAFTSGVLAGVSLSSINVSGYEGDVLSNIETINLSKVVEVGDDRTNVNLPTDAVFIADDNVVQTFQINPTGMSQGTYHLFVDQEDLIDMKGYGVSRVDFNSGNFSGSGDNTVQTLEIYESSAGVGTPILTLKVYGLGREINEGDLIFTGDALLASGIGSDTSVLSNEDLEGMFDAAVEYWKTARPVDAVTITSGGSGYSTDSEASLVVQEATTSCTHMRSCIFQLHLQMEVSMEL